MTGRFHRYKIGRRKEKYPYWGTGSVPTYGVENNCRKLN